MKVVNLDVGRIADTCIGRGRISDVRGYYVAVEPLYLEGPIGNPPGYHWGPAMILTWSEIYEINDHNPM